MVAKTVCQEGANAFGINASGFNRRPWPIACSDRGNAGGFCEERVPCGAAGIDDGPFES